MKILSIISVGGTQSLRGNKLKHCLCFCILPCLLCSCDIWYILPFTGYDERFIHFKTDSVTTRVACVYFQPQFRNPTKSLRALRPKPPRMRFF